MFSRRYRTDGEQLRFGLRRQGGGTLSGKLRGDSINVDLQVPPSAKGGLLAKVKMPNHGLSAESEALKVVETVRMRGARWSQETVKRGDIVTLSAEARRAQDGRRAIVRIFERDPGRGAHDAITRLRPRTEGGAVEVKYQFRYPGDTADILPEWKAPRGYEQPTFFYTVEVAGVTADSKKSKRKGVMTFEDDIELVLTDDQGQPRTDLKNLTLKRPDGQEVQKAPDENGVLRLTDVPPGPFKVVDYTLKKKSESGGS